MVKRTHISFFVAAFSTLVLWTTSAAANTVRDYGAFAHRINVKSLRGGVYDKQDSHSYYFKATLYALLNTPDERSKPLEQRARIAGANIVFGQISVNALSKWIPTASEGTEGAAALVEGAVFDQEMVRLAMVEAMRSLAVREGDLALMGIVEIYRSGKRFYFLGEDFKLGEVAYFPIAPTKFEGKDCENKELVVQDDKGMLAELVVAYGLKPTEE